MLTDFEETEQEIEMGAGHERGEVKFIDREGLVLMGDGCEMGYSLDK